MNRIVRPFEEGVEGVAIPAVERLSGRK